MRVVLAIDLIAAQLRPDAAEDDVRAFVRAEAAPFVEAMAVRIHHDRNAKLGAWAEGAS